MAQATLVVTGKDRRDEVPLEADGLLIGRHPECGLVLDSSRVSRQHARAFQDPFGRWIIEDLGSRNGVLIDGRRVQAHALLPGERVAIGPFTLVLELEEEMPGADAETTATTKLLADATDVQIVSAEAPSVAAMSQARLKELNRILDQLSGLTSPSELYPATCRCLAAAPDSAALVVRLLEPGPEPQPSPQILACYITRSGGTGEDADGTSLYLSRRVLETARSTEETVVAKSIRSLDAQLTLTIVDARQPRAVLCASVGRQKGSTDVLYLDLPLGEAVADLGDFVRAVARHVRLARRSLLLGEVKARSRALDRELASAREIQAKLTPRAMPCVAGLDVALHYEPALWVGGDYCDVWLLPDERLAFAVGDVCGKGLPAAMVMANLQAALRTATLFCSDPSQAVAHVNQHLSRHLPDGMFVTLFLGFLSAGDGRLEYVNAGHIPPLLIRGQAGICPLGRPSNPVLGIMDKPFTTAAEDLPPGTGLLVVTDGVTEAWSPDGTQFSLQRLQAVLTGQPSQSAQDIVRAVAKATAQFRGYRPQHDDMTVLALLRRPAGP